MYIEKEKKKSFLTIKLALKAYDSHLNMLIDYIIQTNKSTSFFFVINK